MKMKYQTQSEGFFTRKQLHNENKILIDYLQNLWGKLRFSFPFSLLVRKPNPRIFTQTHNLAHRDEVSLPLWTKFRLLDTWMLLELWYWCEVYLKQTWVVFVECVMNWVPESGFGFKDPLVSSCAHSSCLSVNIELILHCCSILHGINC